MIVATLIAAAVAAQACPAPPGRDGPPPCAAADVPGCVPGYHREVDAAGRTRYVCDAVRAQPLPPPVVGAPAPAPPAYVPYVPYRPVVAPRRGLLAFVLMPGAASAPTGPHEGDAAGALAVELRGPAGGGRLRFAFEAARQTTLAEMAVKYDFNDAGEVRPFLALGIGGGGIDPDPHWRLEGSLGGGVDVYLTQNLFVTLELKGRAFAHRYDPAYAAVDPGSLHQLAFFAGVGIYL